MRPRSILILGIVAFLLFMGIRHYIKKSDDSSEAAQSKETISAKDSSLHDVDKGDGRQGSQSDSRAKLKRFLETAKALKAKTQKSPPEYRVISPPPPPPPAHDRPPRDERSDKEPEVYPNTVEQALEYELKGMKTDPTKNLDADQLERLEQLKQKIKNITKRSQTE